MTASRPEQVFVVGTVLVVLNYVGVRLRLDLVTRLVAMFVVAVAITLIWEAI